MVVLVVAATSHVQNNDVQKFFIVLKSLFAITFVFSFWPRYLVAW